MSRGQINSNEVNGGKRDGTLIYASRSVKYHQVQAETEDIAGGC